MTSAHARTDGLGNRLVGGLDLQNLSYKPSGPRVDIWAMVTKSFYPFRYIIDPNTKERIKREVLFPKLGDIIDGKFSVLGRRLFEWGYKLRTPVFLFCGPSMKIVVIEGKEYALNGGRIYQRQIGRYKTIDSKLRRLPALTT